MPSKFTFEEYLNNYVSIVDLNGTQYTGFLKEGNYERLVLEPFVADISENQNGPDYQLSNKCTIPFLRVNCIEFVTLNKIENVLIPGLNRMYGPGMQNSLYPSKEKKKDFRLNGDGDGI